MTTKWPVNGLRTCNVLRNSNTYSLRHSRLVFVTSLRSRQYATQRKQAPANASPAPKSVNDPVKSALTAVESNDVSDPINAPRSTLPPPLDLPQRGDEQIVVYWLRIGRAYAGFYKNGIKAVWYNWSAAKLLKQRLGGIRIEDAVRNGSLNRAEFQLLARNSYDVGKLPFFGFLVLIFGEWLPLLVPFIPNAVPGTCRIPKQIRGMQEKAEERRRQSFRMGILEPGHEQLPSGLLGGKEEKTVQEDTEWSIAFNPAYRSRLLNALRADQLLHLSSTLGLHGTLWDRVQLPPPSLLLRHRISSRLAYLAQDDALLLRHRSKSSQLAQEEVHLACAQRGIDVLGKGDGVLRESLTWWLQRQGEDKGMGRAMMVMLFRRLVMRDWVQLHLQGGTDERV